MLIAWQTVNAVRHPNSKTFSRGFLIGKHEVTVRQLEQHWLATGEVGAPPRRDTAWTDDHPAVAIGDEISGDEGEQITGLRERIVPFRPVTTIVEIPGVDHDDYVGMLDPKQFVLAEARQALRLQRLHDPGGLLASAGPGLPHT